jgi:hypothetical protein
MFFQWLWSWNTSSRKWTVALLAERDGRVKLDCKHPRFGRFANRAWQIVYDPHCRKNLFTGCKSISLQFSYSFLNQTYFITTTSLVLRL